MARPYQTSPADRIQSGSSVRNPRGLNDAVLRGRIGHTTGNIRLTPTAATVVGSASYNFGKVDDRAIGTYRLEWQAAASALAEALGAINYAEFVLYESTAGVYLCKVLQVGDADGGLTATGHQRTDATLAQIPAAAGTAVAAAGISLAVADATLVTAVGTTATAAIAVAVGDFVLTDASAASTRVFSLTRIS